MADLYDELNEKQSSQQSSSGKDGGDLYDELATKGQVSQSSEQIQQQTPQVQPQQPTLNENQSNSIAGIRTLGVNPEGYLGKGLLGLQSIGSGAGEAGINLANMVGKISGVPKISDIPELQSKNAPMPGVATVSRELAPMLIPFVGQEGLAAKGVGLATKYLPEGLKTIGGIAARGAARAPYGAGFGAISEVANKENASKEDILGAAKVGMALNVAIPGLLDSVPGAYKSIVSLYKNAAERDKSIGGGIRTPEQAREVSDNLKEDILSFPDLVRAPKLQSFYHSVAKYFPFSGIKKDQQLAMGRLEEDANDVSSKILGNANEADEVSARKGIVDDVQKYSKNEYEKMKPKYEDLDKEADERGIKVSLVNASSFAKEMLEKQKKLIVKPLGSAEETIAKRMAQYKEAGLEDLMPSETLAKLSPAQKDKYMRAYEKSSPKTIGDGEGVPMGFEDLRADIGSLNDKAADLKAQGEFKKAKFYSDMSSAYRKDMESSLEKSGHKDLFERNKELSKEYKEKVVPFLHSDDKDMLDLINGKLDTNSTSLERLFKNTQNEKALQQLPQETKNKIFSRMLMQNVNEKLTTRAQKVTDAYGKLNDYEKSILSQEDKKALDSLSSRATQLSPLYKNSTKIWQHMHKLKYGLYLAGIPVFHYLGGMPLGTLMGGLGLSAKFLKSKGLQEAYMGGKIPGENLPKYGSKLGQYLTEQSEGE